MKKISLLFYPVARVLFAVMVAFFCSFYFNESERYWLVLTVFLLIPVDKVTTFPRQIAWSLGLGLIAALTVWIAGLLSQSAVLLALYLSGVSFCGLFFPSFFLVAVLAIISGGIAVTHPFQRIEFVLIGAGIVAVSNLVFWRRPENIYFAKCLNALKKLQQTFLEIYIKRDYQDKFYLYERQIHKNSQVILQLLSQIRQLPRFDIEKLKYLNHLQANIFALGHLRYRVSDFATFEIIARELKEISNLDFASELLNQQIESLEDIYHNTLQVVAPDPLVFLLFIQNLRDLEKCKI